jgi:hypothetical protein
MSVATTLEALKTEWAADLIGSPFCSSRYADAPCALGRRMALAPPGLRQQKPLKHARETVMRSPPSRLHTRWRDSDLRQWHRPALVGVTVNAAPVAMFESCAMLAPALAIPELASVVPDAWNPVQTSTFSGRVEFDRSAEG